MSLLTTVDHLHRFVVVRATGEISTSEVLAHLDAERAESGLAYRELIDGRGARLHWSSADARKIVEAIRHRSRSTRFGPTA
ncbi:MAG TPA: hypothetical protein VG712_07740, partial [Gemmatimonadales bacterium]|nr:hypothetical protein [Gemmatimonadales bacterium]